MNLGPGINKGIFKYVGTNQDILSVGCGSGLLEAEAKKKNNKVYALDISEENIKIVKAIAEEAYVCDIEKVTVLPFKKKKFDVIILSDILEHLLNPEKALVLMKQYLKDGGFLVASIPNVANWTVRIPFIFGSFNYKEDGIVVWPHYRFFTNHSIKKMFKKCGYTIINVDYTTSIINVCYDYFKRIWGRKENTSLRLSFSNKPAPLFKKIIRKIIEWGDYKITGLWKGLFAFQYIIIAKKE